MKPDFLTKLRQFDLFPGRQTVGVEMEVVGIARFAGSVKGVSREDRVAPDPAAREDGAKIPTPASLS